MSANEEYLRAILGDIDDPKYDDEHIGTNAQLLKRIYEQGIGKSQSLLEVEILDELPDVGEGGTLYLIPKEGSEPSEGIYNKYIWIVDEERFVLLGDTHIEVDVEDYLKKEQLLDAGIKSIEWTTNVNGTFTTVEDPLKTQRPSETNTRYWVEMPSCPYFYHSKMYRVTFNGEVYDNLECKYGILVDEDKGTVIGSDKNVSGVWQMIGNRALYDSRYIDTGEPFAILYVEHGGMHTGGAYYYSSTVGHGILLTKSAMDVNLKIETATITKKDLPHCLDENFGVGDNLFETISNSTYPRSSWGQGNIVGRGSFAIGNSNISIGQFSLAEGDGNYVSGAKSHAEGLFNKITEGGSHAEGQSNTITSQFAHTEGCFNTVSGNWAHAEGGYNTASGYFSHAEGGLNTASKNGSHAEGLGTKASSDYQHTQGQYNKEDAQNKYAHIVGNGTSDTSRSNAHTLDWKGNAWYQGKVESASGVLKLGNTEVNESQLQALLALLGE